MQFDAWLHELPTDYCDREFILDGVRNGFHIVNVYEITGYVRVSNHASAVDPTIAPKVDEAIQTEIAHGRYKVVTSPPNIISPLGAIVKASGNGIRLIHDCSRPAGRSLNDYATRDSIHFQTLDDARRFITPGCWMAKVDLESAYRSVKIHPSNYTATGLAWKFADKDEILLVDTRLPFGARKSVFIFDTLSRAVVAIMKSKGFLHILSYLDDFFICEKTFDKCLLALNTLIRLLRSLGFSISFPKVIGPAHQLVFLGILIDSLSMTFSLPADKIVALQEMINDALSCRTFTKRQLQVIAGRLCFATRVYHGGLCFLRRLVDVINKLKKPWSRFHMNKTLRLDLEWWKDILPRLQGTAPIIDTREAEPIIISASRTDLHACSLTTYEVAPLVNFTAAAYQLPPTYRHVLAAVLAALCWHSQWVNKRIYMHCSCVGAVAIINKGSCNNALVMTYLRELWRLSVLFNFRITARLYLQAKDYVQYVSTPFRRTYPRREAQMLPAASPCRLDEVSVLEAPNTVQCILSPSTLQRVACYTPNNCKVRDLLGSDVISADHSVPSRRPSPNARNARLLDTDVRRPSGALHATGHCEGLRYAANPDEADHTCATVPPLSLAGLYYPCRSSFLGSSATHVLHPSTSQQRSGTLRQQAATTPRCHLLPQRHGHLRTRQQNTHGGRAGAYDQNTGSPGPPLVSCGCSACRLRNRVTGRYQHALTSVA